MISLIRGHLGIPLKGFLVVGLEVVFLVVGLEVVKGI